MGGAPGCCLDGVGYRGFGLRIGVPPGDIMNNVLLVVVANAFNSDTNR